MKSAIAALILWAVITAVWIAGTSVADVDGNEVVSFTIKPLAPPPTTGI